LQTSAAGDKKEEEDSKRELKARFSSQFPRLSQRGAFEEEQLGRRLTVTRVGGSETNGLLLISTVLKIK
jgi:hypothetical protein